ncbi:hypothetical protein JCM3765_006212 [Sporobolomyces pararoseus]
MSIPTKTLTSLPPELLSAIAAQVQYPHTVGWTDRLTLKALSLVSRKLANPAQERLLSELYVIGFNELYRIHGSAFRGVGGRLKTLEEAGKLGLVRKISLSPNGRVNHLHNPRDIDPNDDSFDLPSLRTSAFPPIRHIVDFLVRFPNLNELSITCFPFLSLPSDQFSRLSQPLANITSLKVVTPPWDPDHQFLRQIVQLTPQLSTLTLERYCLPDRLEFKPCSSPLPYLSNLTHLKLEGQYYLALAELNLFSPEQFDTISRLTISQFSDPHNILDLPEGYGKRFGQLFAKGVRHFEWLEWFDLDTDEPPETVNELESMLPLLVNCRKVTLNYFFCKSEWVLASIPASVKVVDLGWIADQLKDMMLQLLDDYVESDRYARMQGKVLRICGTQEVEHEWDDFWVRFGHFGFDVEFTKMPSVKRVKRS